MVRLFLIGILAITILHIIIEIYMSMKKICRNCNYYRLINRDTYICQNCYSIECNKFPDKTDTCREFDWKEEE
jgi:RNA polymerase subunit RPABC4/transcription elongation factor Spt4